MGVPLVTAQTTFTNLFSHPNKRLGALLINRCIVLLGIIIFTLGGCQRNPSERVWGQTKDVTEYLHHRLQAGIFELDKDPFIYELIPDSSRTLRMPFKRKTGAHETARISWERGSFWVQTDNHALIVVYLDEETVFSHIQVAPVKGFQTIIQFREFPKPPIRNPRWALSGM